MREHIALDGIQRSHTLSLPSCRLSVPRVSFKYLQSLTHHSNRQSYGKEENDQTPLQFLTGTAYEVALFLLPSVHARPFITIPHHQPRSATHDIPSLTLLSELLI
jgi:hypothetical protein